MASGKEFHVLGTGSAHVKSNIRNLCSGKTVVSETYLVARIGRHVRKSVRTLVVGRLANCDARRRVRQRYECTRDYCSSGIGDDAGHGCTVLRLERKRDR